MDKYELMQQSIEKNIQELSELLVDNKITDAYMLMETINKTKQLVEIGLKYNVDYVYILQDIEKLLNGTNINIKIENYLDY